MIIELVNGIKIYADGVEIAPDGTLTAYDSEKESGVEEQLEEFNAHYGGDDTQSVEKDLAKSIAYQKLGVKAQELYDHMLARKKSATANEIAEEMGITRAALHGRLKDLRRAGLARSPKSPKNHWKAV